jgi:hypothetical protein
MFGRAPMFMPMEAPPQMYAPQAYAPQAYAPQAYAPPPHAPSPYATPVAAPQSSWTRPAQAPAPVSAPPAPRTWRGQETEDAKLNLPSPEQLGLNRPPAPVVARLDWTAVHERLDRLGATCFHLEKLARGARVTCLLPTAKADCTHRIEAVADSEAEAVALAVAQAERWVNGK